MRSGYTCLIFVILCLTVAFSPSNGVCRADPDAGSSHVFLLLIREQSLAGPQRAWWASEVDLSTTETAIAQHLTAQGYQVRYPAQLTDTLQNEPAFRYIDISSEDSLSLAKAGNADYIITGKAVASAGGRVLSSQMRSCFAHVALRIINVATKNVIAHIQTDGSSVHLDTITGTNEALRQAADKAALKIISILIKKEKTP